MKYPNIKAAHLSHAQIAKAFGYANVKSFRTSSAHQRHMRGLDDCLGIYNTAIQNRIVKEVLGSDFSDKYAKDYESAKGEYIEYQKIFDKMKNILK